MSASPGRPRSCARGCILRWVLVAGLAVSLDSLPRLRPRATSTRGSSGLLPPPARWAWSSSISPSASRTRTTGCAPGALDADRRGRADRARRLLGRALRAAPSRHAGVGDSADVAPARSSETWAAREPVDADVPSRNSDLVRTRARAVNARPRRRRERIDPSRQRSRYRAGRRSRACADSRGAAALNSSSASSHSRRRATPRSSSGACSRRTRAVQLADPRRWASPSRDRRVSTRLSLLLVLGGLLFLALAAHERFGGGSRFAPPAIRGRNTLSRADRRAALIAWSVLCLLLAVGLGLLAADVARYRDALLAGTSGTAFHRRRRSLEHASRHSLRLDTRLLDVQDDVDFRRAVRAMRLARLDDETVSDPPGLRSSAAKRRHGWRQSRRRQGSARRSRAANLLGRARARSVHLGDTGSCSAAREHHLEPPAAIELDPSNDEAKYNLELALQHSSGIELSEAAGGGTRHPVDEARRERGRAIPEAATDGRACADLSDAVRGPAQRSALVIPLVALRLSVAARAARGVLALSEPAGAELVALPALVFGGVLLGLAATQPIVEQTRDRGRTDAEAFVVIDVSRSMLARRTLDRRHGHAGQVCRERVAYVACQRPGRHSVTHGSRASASLSECGRGRVRGDARTSDRDRAAPARSVVPHGRDLLDALAACAVSTSSRRVRRRGSPSCSRTARPFRPNARLARCFA